MQRFSQYLARAALLTAAFAFYIPTAPVSGLLLGSLFFALLYEVGSQR